MRSAQSRLGLVTSLGSAGRGVRSCVNALPVPTPALKAGGIAAVGLAGVLLLRGLFSSRRKSKAPAAALVAKAAAPQNNVGSYLLSEAVLTLLLPLCRRYFLGENVPSGSFLARLLRQDAPGSNPPAGH